MSISPPIGRSSTHEIYTIQAIRAIAATMVVSLHSTYLLHDKFSLAFVPWENGNAGVDLFFVISGFIMVLSTRKLLDKSDGWKIFLKARIIRVGPLYWLATICKIASVLAVPSLALHTVVTPWNAVASLLFLPSLDGTNQVRFALVVGWTLAFEMLFYLSFSAALAARRSPLIVVAATMLLIIAVRFVIPDRWYVAAFFANPLVLEFVSGMSLLLIIAKRGQYLG